MVLTCIYMYKLYKRNAIADLSCPPVEQWAGLELENASTCFGHSVNLSCSAGLVMGGIDVENLDNGTLRVQCNQHAEWTPHIPTCKSKLQTIRN